MTTTTIKSRYWAGLYKFVDFAIAEKLYRGPRPKFVCIDPENLAPLPRDAFDDKELLDLLRLPLFTGCKNRLHVWQPGEYFVHSRSRDRRDDREARAAGDEANEEYSACCKKRSRRRRAHVA
ncbi:hypothetical protein [Bradyrhizobium sp. 187]|uniref:hypothetical protein n=1 Tax=Bradyrhizobium sp. 187 TaxID=2782655 RepID=UPI002000410D|nr:hypothetical protein [Bradyrhizobium sp. 187]